MSRRSSVWIPLSIACVLLAATVPSCQDEEGQLAESFLKKPMMERRTAILEYSPEQQVDLFLKAMIAKHPPDLGLADVVASNGSKIVPSFSKRLAHDDRDVAKMHVVDVFVRMQELGYYDVASDGETMNLLEQQVAAMKDPQWKEMSRDGLNRIRAQK